MLINDNIMKKNKLIGIRVTEEQLRQITFAANKDNRKVSDFCRVASLNKAKEAINDGKENKTTDNKGNIEGSRN